MDEPRSALKPVLAVVGAVVSTFLISTVFFKWQLHGIRPVLAPRFSFGAFLVDIPRHLHWMVPFALLTAAIVPLRASQWRWTLSHSVRWKERYHLVAIGNLANSTIPGKLGELVRAFLMSREQRIPFIESLGSVVVGKLLELAALIGLLALSLQGPFRSAAGRLAVGLRWGTGVCLVLLVVVVVLAHHAAALAKWLAEHHKAHRLEQFFLSVAAGLGTARSFRGMAVALFFSIGPVLASAIAYGLGLQALGIKGGWAAGPVVLAAVSLGQSAVGVPAGLGIYYFVTSWAARVLGAAPDQAAAFAALTHLTTGATFIGLGALSLWARGLRLNDLRRGRDLATEAARHVGEPESEKVLGTSCPGEDSNLHAIASARP